jgi:cytochrome c
MKRNIVAFGIGGAMALSAAAANAALDDAKAEALMKSGGCSVCHAVDKKLIGPAYKEVAQKHKGEADAVAKLEKAVRSGSKDVYGGKIPMPPTPPAKISDADLHALLEWVLTR